MTEQDPAARQPVRLDREDAAAPTIDADLDEGVGNVRPEEVTPLDPDDEGVGDIRPDEVAPPDRRDEGLGDIRPDEVSPPDEDDEGLGSLGTNG
jgi:hypothetical protein